MTQPTVLSYALHKLKGILLPLVTGKDSYIQYSTIVTDFSTSKHGISM